MRLTSGEKVKNINLPAIDGSSFDLQSLKGKPYMISFFRFAACPFCNMRMHELVKRYDEFGEDFSIVAIFDSSIGNLTKHTKKHGAPFSVLADKSNKYYKAYGIEHSLAGMLKGVICRFPTLSKGY